MNEKIDKSKKKTLSLKLGSKPLLAPNRNIEVGKTVIVEKKRFKRALSTETQDIKKDRDSDSQKKVNTSDSEIKSQNNNRSGVLLKPLSKDEQKKILKADNKKDKKNEIEKIRKGNLNINAHSDVKNEINLQKEPKEIKKENDRKKTDDNEKEFNDKKRLPNNFGRKKIRERKVTIVTALSETDERTRSLAAYKRAKQKTKKNKLDQEPVKKIVRDVYIPEHKY